MDHRAIKAKRLKQQRDRVVDVLARFTDRVFDEVERRSQMTALPDGFPTNTRYGPRDGGPSSVQHEPGCIWATDPFPQCECGETQATSTERAALRLIEGRPEHDPQQTSCERIDDAFQEMWTSVIKAERAWDLILHSSEAIRGRQTTLGTCQACLRDDVPNVGSDRIVAGYCATCFKAWQRTDGGHGRQDRLSFERERRQLRVVRDDDPGARTGYGVDEIDALVANGSLPSSRAKHAPVVEELA